MPTVAATPVLRFAPSPTGRLHLGHALSALINVEMAARLRGRLLIRIEDTDSGRCRPEYLQSILEDLQWLGVHTDAPILVQSQHLAVYAAAAARLAGMGLLYPCFATRQEILQAAGNGPVDPDGAPLYPGLHRGLPAAEVARRQAAGEPFAMRLDMARALTVAAKLGAGKRLTFTELDAGLNASEVTADAAVWGDVIIQRKGSPASYHLAVVVDDARQGVTHVVRGSDLRAATAIHRLLQVLLQLPQPLYRHHRLITASDGRKLSKRSGDTGLSELREQGMTPADIRALLVVDAPSVP